MSDFEVKDKDLDKLTELVRSEFFRALMTTNSTRVGRYSLKEVLRNCFDQKHGILSCEDKEAIEELGVNLYVNFTDLKVSTLVALFRSLFIDTADMPFVIEPTPIAELSKKARDSTLELTKRELDKAFMEGQEISIEAMVSKIKNEQFYNEQNFAKKAAKGMEKVIADQCVEGNFSSALYGCFDDKATYPFYAMLGPIPSMVPVMKWQGDSLKTKLEKQMQFKRVSPFDVFWTPDSPDAQRGTAVYVRRRVSVQFLYDAMKMKSYREKQIKEVLEEGLSGRAPLLWVSRNPEQQFPYTQWYRGDLVETVTRYGRIKGSNLEGYVTGIESDQTYETQITFIDRHIIQAHINPNPNASLRPIHISSYQKMGDMIPGMSIAQKIRDPERACISMLRSLINNGATSSMPITEIDMSRIAEWIPDIDKFKLSPGMILPVSGDITGGGRRAFTFNTIPSMTPQILGIINYFTELMHQITQIPAVLHGQPVGTGVNRTVRGLLTLQGNIMKPIESALTNLDKDIFEPIGTSLYNYNMEYSDDDSIKGDAKVRARGSAALVQKEVKRGSLLEAAQIVGNYGDKLSPEVTRRVTTELLDAIGVTDGIEDPLLADTPMPPEQQAPQMPPQPPMPPEQ